jgi:uncharacterized protein
MCMMKVIHFEILADDPERIATSYEAVLGWAVDRPDGAEQYWLVDTGPSDVPGITGGIMARHFPQPVINTVEVTPLDDVVAKVAAAGGTVMHGPNVIPGVGTHGYFKNPEGNIFGAIQPEAG